MKTDYCDGLLLSSLSLPPTPTFDKAENPNLLLGGIVLHCLIYKANIVLSHALSSPCDPSALGFSKCLNSLRPGSLSTEVYDKVGLKHVKIRSFLYFSVYHLTPTAFTVYRNRRTLFVLINTSRVLTHQL